MVTEGIEFLRSPYINSRLFSFSFSSQNYKKASKQLWYRPRSSFVAQLENSSMVERRPRTWRSRAILDRYFEYEVTERTLC